MNSQTVALKCGCGKVEGSADVSPINGRFICYCDDCQTFAHFLGKAGQVLDIWGGTEIVPIAPAHVKLEKGLENLKCVRLSEKGMYRWYAGCCNTPIGNTPSATFLPHVGVIHSIFDVTSKEKTFGPVLGKINGKYAHGKAMPADLKKSITPKAMWASLKFIANGFIKGEARPSPFLKTGSIAPVVTPQVLTVAERAKIRDAIPFPPQK